MSLLHFKIACGTINVSEKRVYREETRRTTILQPVEWKPHSQKDRQDEKAKDYVSDEGTR